MISQQFEQMLEEMTPEERQEVEFFATFVLARRGSQKKIQILTDDISTPELMRLVSEAGSFDWLNTPEEDRYSVEDGEDVQWPQGL